MTEDQRREIQSICANIARITAMIASDFALLSKALNEWRAEQDNWRREQQKININSGVPF